VAGTWPDWPGGTVSVQRDLLYRRLTIEFLSVGFEKTERTHHYS
jgi:hypothetical protein